MRVALYARVSTHDQQTFPLQLDAMHNYVAKQGWKTALDSRMLARVQACGPSGRS